MGYISLCFFAISKLDNLILASNLHISYSIPSMFELILKIESIGMQLVLNGKKYSIDYYFHLLIESQKKTQHESFC